MTPTTLPVGTVLRSRTGRTEYVIDSVLYKVTVLCAENGRELQTVYTGRKVADLLQSGEWAVKGS